MGEVELSLEQTSRAKYDARAENVKNKEIKRIFWNIFVVLAMSYVL